MRTRDSFLEIHYRTEEETVRKMTPLIGVTAAIAAAFALVGAVGSSPAMSVGDLTRDGPAANLTSATLYGDPNENRGSLHDEAVSRFFSHAIYQFYPDLEPGGGGGSVDSQDTYHMATSGMDGVTEVASRCLLVRCSSSVRA